MAIHGNTGKKRTKEARQRMSEAQMGRPAWNKGKKASKKTRRKMSKSAMGRIAWNKGKKHTDESKNKMSKSHKGMKFSKEHKKRIGNANKGNKNALGHRHTDETKRKMSEASKGKKLSEEAKEKIRQANLGKKRSKEACKNMSKSGKGRIFSNDHKRKISEAHAKGIKEGRLNPGKHGTQGGFYSKKNKKTLHYRSLLEKSWYQLLEQMSKVKKYQVEPYIIPYEFEGSQRNYIPDLIIVYTDGTSELVEIKPEGDFFRKNPKNKAKWKATIKWCKARKRLIIFKVVGYGELN